MTIRFEQPAWLWLALLALPLALAAIVALRRSDPLRLVVVVALRVLSVGLIAIALAEPTRIESHRALTVTGILDVSGSVRRFPELAGADLTSGSVRVLRDWFRRAAALREDDDRFGLVVFDGRAAVAIAPTRRDVNDDSWDVTMAEGSDLASAVRLGLTLFPADTGRRLVLASDGNETRDDVLAAASAAAGAGVSIDVLPVPYEVHGDVQVLRVEAPPSGRPDQAIALRVVLESTVATRGRLSLLANRVPVDLDAATGATSLAIAVPAGRSVQLLEVRLPELPVSRYEAVFDPDDPADDRLAENDRAETTVSTVGADAVLLVSGRTGEHPLAAALRGAGMRVVETGPDGVPADLAELQRYDLVVLDDVPGPAFEAETQAAIATYVNDLGGGLLFGGGKESFASGGWVGSSIAPLLPIDLRPPKTLVRPRAALILVLDKSGSMAFPVAGARASQQTIANEAAVAAVESLGAASYVGVIAFDSQADVVMPPTVNDDPAPIARAIRSIQPEGGTNLTAGLEAAERMLAPLGDVETRQVVFLTDGRGRDGDPVAVARRLAESGVRVTTIAVGDEADQDELEAIAKAGNGQFHAVRNPRVLPRVLVDSVRVVSKPLFVERPFQPAASGAAAILTPLLAATPQLLGLNLASRRDDPTAQVALSGPDGEPLLATWQAGLGRATAFASELAGPWSAPWLEWSDWAALWASVARATARPASPVGLDASAAIDGDRLRIEVALDPARGGVDGVDALRFDVLARTPAGGRERIDLRRDGSLRFAGEAAAAESGAYVVTIVPRIGDRPLAPLIATATRPAGEEFRRLRSDPAVLEEVARITGGTVLDLAAPEGSGLYRDAHRRTIESRLPAWPFALAVALASLLLDIAARRIAWSGRAVGAALRGATASVTTPTATTAIESRAAAGLAGAWSGVRSAAPGRAEFDVAAADAASATDDAAADLVATSSSRPAPRHEAVPNPPQRQIDPEAVRRALDALRRASRPGTPDGAQPPEQPSSPAPGSDSDTMSSLLEARRRARGS